VEASGKKGTRLACAGQTPIGETDSLGKIVSGHHKAWRRGGNQMFHDFLEWSPKAFKRPGTGRFKKKNMIFCGGNGACQGRSHSRRRSVALPKAGGAILRKILPKADFSQVLK